MKPETRAALGGIAVAAAFAGTAHAVDRAVVVGIDDYPGIALDRPLTQARSDALRFRNHLIDDLGFAPENVTVLTDDQATSTAIIDALFDDLVRGTEPGDRAVFYFAGLGGRAPDMDGVEIDSYEEFLLAHGPDDPFALIPESAFVEIFDSIGDRRVSMVIDAAMTAPRAGVYREGDAVAARAVDLMQIGVPTRQVMPENLGPVGEATFMESPFGTGEAARDVWVSAAPSQVGWEAPEGGVFTDAYLEGAHGAADMNGNGTVTNAELLVYLREASENWCNNVQTCSETGLGLTPDFSGDVMDVVSLVQDQVGAIVGGEAEEDDGAAEEVAEAVEPEEAEAPVEETAASEPPAAPLSVPAAEIASTDNTLAFITDLFAASNDAGIRIEMEPAGELVLGETVTFTVSSDHAGTLLLLDVNPEGELFQIFPSRLSLADAARIGAGDSLIIPEAVASSGRPMQINVTEPAGPGFLVAILVEGDVPVYEQILPQNLNLDPIPNAEQYLYELAQALLEMQARQDGNAAVEWSAAYMPYTIVE